MIEHVISQWDEEQQKKKKGKKAKKESHNEVKIDEDNEESVMERFAQAMSESSKNKSRLKKDIAQLREIFCEDNSTDVFRPKCISDGEFEREKMIKKYSKYRSERYERIRLKQLDEDVMKDKDKKILKDDSKSYVKLRSRLRECSGDDDMEAFSRSEDMILNACRNCGCNPFSYDPLRSKQMTEEEVLVKQQIVESGIKPIYSYSEYLLCLSCLSMIPELWTTSTFDLWKEQTYERVHCIQHVILENGKS